MKNTHHFNMIIKRIMDHSGIQTTKMYVVYFQNWNNLETMATYLRLWFIVDIIVSEPKIALKKDEWDAIGLIWTRYRTNRDKAEGFGCHKMLLEAYINAPTIPIIYPKGHFSRLCRLLYFYFKILRFLVQNQTNKYRFRQISTELYKVI
jgi:hypothetical protein